MSRVLLPVPPVYLRLPVLHLNRSCLAEALRDAIARAVAALLERPLRPEAASPFGMRLHVLHIPLPTHMRIEPLQRYPATSLSPIFVHP